MAKKSVLGQIKSLERKSDSLYKRYVLNTTGTTPKRIYNQLNSIGRKISKLKLKL